MRTVYVLTLQLTVDGKSIGLQTFKTSDQSLADSVFGEMAQELYEYQLEEDEHEEE
jgi:hypothetical protein